MLCAGVWGMTYKYHERAIVINERNMHRVWDVAYDGYNAGKGIAVMQWEDAAITRFKENQQDTGTDYDGDDIVVVPMHMENVSLPSPMPYQTLMGDNSHPQYITDTLVVNDMLQYTSRFYARASFDEKFRNQFDTILGNVNSQLNIVSSIQQNHSASSGAISNETTSYRMFYQGSVRIHESATPMREVTGCGHHGPDYTGVASVRNGKSIVHSAAPGLRYLPAPAAKA